ncbi:MAG: fibronectin type III domain-containing protein [Paludibacteraceae bacterium]|nr:fibronectin type III domain-containing protein [Paludibacteraceae bacterium]
MKKLFTLFALCCMFLSAIATDRYVAASGSDSNDGLSWANAKASVKTAVSASSAGDNVYVGAGVYNEQVAVKDGVNMFGGYNPATGERDIEVFKTILDGTGLNNMIIVKYDNDCTNPTLIEGFVLQNAEHSHEGGGAFIRGNMTLKSCTITNCSGSNGGGVYARSKTEGVPAVITDCVIELCSATSSGGGAYLYENAVMENCIVRGCAGKYGAIRSHKAGVIVRNCVLHNNAATVDGWPDSGGIFNETGAEAYNLTICNNYGAKYAGCHSEGQMYNSVFWGNQAEEGFTDPTNFISASSASSDNWADQGFDGESFASLSLSKDNNAENGPHFKFPTTFAGLPKNAGEIAVMRAADFSLSAASPLINKGNAAKAPSYDIEGKTRPIGTGVEIGAYEFDPNAAVVKVTGVSIAVDTLTIVEDQVDGLAAIVTPKNATNKAVTWSIADPTIASIDQNGGVVGLKIGKTIATVKTEDGGFTATAVVVVNQKPPVFYPDEVLAADTLYPIENYTIPSYVPFWVAREAARLDSLTTDHALIAEKIAAMNEAIGKLVPKEEPYNMVANINGDPATRMAFCWFTNEGITDGKVQLLKKADATAEDFESASDLITVDATPTNTRPLRYAVSTSGLLKATGMDPKTSFRYVSHKAIAENLTPGSTYSWRVGYAGHWSDIAQFQTKATAEGEYSFVYMTDSHIMDEEYVNNAKWCATAVAKNETDARFCVFPGDFVETGTNANSEWEWERWFEESIRPVIMNMPIVPTDGNHDDSENLNYTYHFNTDNQFNKTAKVKPQFDGITYSFVYGDVLFLVYSKQDYWRGSYSYSALTSTYLTNDVGNWFRSQVAAHPEAKYRVALVHKNVFSGSGHSVDEETPLFRATMLPIFKDCEIDLVLQGHDHCYEVIGPVNPDTRRPIMDAISDVKSVEINTNKNMTGKEGGTFVTDDGTLYFIGATCGRKRYYPYDRAKMDDNYDKHKMTDYFDLFTGMFGQPGAPSYTKITVTEEALLMNSYTADSEGNSTLFNTMKVKRTKEHTVPSGFEDVNSEPVIREGRKFIQDGNIYIRHNEHTYNIFGSRIE